jgi:hypothetical protein
MWLRSDRTGVADHEGEQKEEGLRVVTAELDREVVQICTSRSRWGGAARRRGEARRGSAQVREGCGVQRVCAPENVPVTIDRPGFDSNRAFRSAMCHSEIGVTTYESVILILRP